MQFYHKIPRNMSSGTFSWIISYKFNHDKSKLKIELNWTFLFNNCISFQPYCFNFYIITRKLSDCYRFKLFININIVYFVKGFLSISFLYYSVGCDLIESKSASNLNHWIIQFHAYYITKQTRSKKSSQRKTQSRKTIMKNMFLTGRIFVYFSFEPNCKHTPNSGFK